MLTRKEIQFRLSRYECGLVALIACNEIDSTEKAMSETKGNDVALQALKVKREALKEIFLQATERVKEIA